MAGEYITYTIKYSGVISTCTSACEIIIIPLKAQAKATYLYKTRQSKQLHVFYLDCHWLLAVRSFQCSQYPPLQPAHAAHQGYEVMPSAPFLSWFLLLA